MTKRIYKERRIYFSANCEKCGNSFQSFKRSKVKHGLCRNCRKVEVDKNQVSLFPPIEVKDYSENSNVAPQPFAVVAGVKELEIIHQFPKKLECNCSGIVDGNHLTGCPFYWTGVDKGI